MIILFIIFVISIASLILYQINQSYIKDKLEFLNHQSEQATKDFNAIKSSQEDIKSNTNSINGKVDNLNSNFESFDSQVKDDISSIKTQLDSENKLLKDSLIDISKELSTVKHLVINITNRTT